MISPIVKLFRVLHASGLHGGEYYNRHDNFPEPEPEVTSHSHPPYIIGISGGTAAGKTSLAKIIKSQVNLTLQSRVGKIGQDAFYRDYTAEEQEEIKAGNFNFDHPNALDFEALHKILQEIKLGREVDVPVYDFKQHRRTHMVRHVPRADVYIIEGILIFHEEKIRNQFDLKIFVDVDSDTRLIRRIKRDIKERGRDIISVLHQYETFVKPSFESFCQPLRCYADVILPRGTDNAVGIDLVVRRVEHSIWKAIQRSNDTTLHQKKRSSTAV